MFTKDSYNFWKQEEPADFEYTTQYAEEQATTPEMVHLRLGYMAAAIGLPRMQRLDTVDVGAGNREFARTAGPMLKSVSSYDVVGESISNKELYTRKWGLAVFADVIEHVDTLAFFLAVPWRYAYISFPETPAAATWEELKAWRHFKPDEHVWMLNAEGFRRFLQDWSPSCEILLEGDPEDAIRRGEHKYRNITTFVLER